MESSKNFIKIFFGVCFGVLVLVCGVNYVVDPYCYFDVNNLKKPKNITKPLMYKLPIVKKGGYDNIMLGTSRIGVMKTEVVSRYLGGKTFNLSSPSSLADEQLAILKYAIKFNNIKNVIYAIDFMSVNGSRAVRDSDFDELKEKILHFDDVRSYTNLKDLFSLDTVKATFITLRYNFTNYKDTIYLEDGRRDYQGIKEQIKSGKFVLKYDEIEGVRNNKQYNPFSISEANFNAIREIVELCKSKNINLIVYTPPMYARHFIAIAKNLNNEFFEFKRRLVEIVDYIDLSGVNSISINKENYYDESHLRDNLSDIVFARIFNDKNVSVPNDFGVLVTKDNIDSHIANLRKQIADYNLSTLK